MTSGRGAAADTEPRKKSQSSNASSEAAPAAGSGTVSVGRSCRLFSSGGESEKRPSDATRSGRFVHSLVAVN